MNILCDYALQFVGLPYRWGGDDTINGFDCSGLVQELLSAVGLDPQGDQSAQGLYDYFSTRSNHDQRGCGALVFFGKSIKEITHIGMMLNSFLMIEAGGGGSKTIDEKAAADQNAYVRVRPYNRRTDVVAILMPYFPVEMNLV